MKGLNTEALRGLQGIRGIIALIVPGVWVSEVSVMRVFQTVRIGNQIKEKSWLCFVNAPRAGSSELANS